MPHRGPEADWSIKEDVVLYQCYVVEGLSARETAACIVGRTRNAVIARLNRLSWSGMKGRGYRPWDAPNGYDELMRPGHDGEPPPVLVEIAGKTPDLDRKGPKIVDMEREAPPWRCKTPGCRGTKQPGRDCCAACISANAPANKRRYETDSIVKLTSNDFTFWG